ncbi:MULTISPECIES: hypothetical protein [unclassified Bradyrhizobium]|uniref:hypothetical protein n=1 Tax=unclassified Bradyrhizobium TaxID=2631580 RepID=UPI001CD2613E|nr:MULTISPECIES: hypothetical protein [unclassified Bradyrhizobium]MCA1386463.1 hypothetical protein [Bradyrhizobium sp. BRP05]MCA1394568.1 hypothetical protein [Bradyrhizobium sp. IC3123]MCA1424196.1 hypothetical protein [Bradyrhizobium sp. BRP23]MCA1431288.1 hypothetical protein [Bradyrhizobium sp. NBAIM16]MCA1480675.1 hypothetical protein [Bradyrhizobium sp. NBAIM08]
MDQLQASRFLQVYDRAAIRKGVKISIGFDFHEYVAITERTPTKGRTYPIFRPDTSPIKAGEGYWIVGVDKNNDVVLVEAARLYDLSSSNLKEHLESLRFFYADPSKHAHPDDCCICKAPIARQITGRVVFRGDIWVRGDFRRQGMPKIMEGIMRGVSFAMWAPDFMCGLAGTWSVEKRVYDITRCEPGGSILRLVNENIVDDDWLFWTPGEELIKLVNGYDGSAVVFPS